MASFRVRQVTDAERSAAVQRTMASGLRVKITAGQGKAIAEKQASPKA